MPLVARIADATPIIRTQATGQGATEQPVTPPGAERVEGAFGVFGMVIAGLIIVFAVVLLFLRSRRKP
jgi:hypothetical protein